MKYIAFLRACTAMLAVCLCLSASGCSPNGEESSSSTSPSQSSSIVSDSQPDIVGSSQAPLPEVQATIPAPAISIQNQTEGNIQVKIASPHFSGFSGADELNAKIEQEQQESIAELRSIANSGAETGATSSLFYQSVFDYQENGLLSVWLTNENYAGGAHGMNWVCSYNLNPETGEFYAFRDLFRNPEEAIPEVTEKILSYLKGILPDDADQSLYPSASQAIQALNGDYSYYLEGENLVVYFQPYDVLPYAVGIVRVPIPLVSLPDTTVALHSMSARRTIRANGQDTELGRNMMLGSEGNTAVLLPMPETARLCGMEATVKNQVCIIDSQEYPITYANGGAFMTLTDFLALAPDDANHLVAYGPDDILRIYTIKD